MNKVMREFCYKIFMEAQGLIDDKKYQRVIVIRKANPNLIELLDAWASMKGIRFRDTKKELEEGQRLSTSCSFPFDHASLGKQFCEFHVSSWL